MWSVTCWHLLIEFKLHHFPHSFHPVCSCNVSSAVITCLVILLSCFIKLECWCKKCSGLWWWCLFFFSNRQNIHADYSYQTCVNILRNIMLLFCGQEAPLKVSYQVNSRNVSFKMEILLQEPVLSTILPSYMLCLLISFAVTAWNGFRSCYYIFNNGYNGLKQEFLFTCGTMLSYCSFQKLRCSLQTVFSSTVYYSKTLLTAAHSICTSPPNKQDIVKRFCNVFSFRHWMPQRHVKTFEKWV